MTRDPVLHALVDLCEAVGKDMPLRHPYEQAMQVIREHTGLSAVPEGTATTPPYRLPPGWSLKRDGDDNEYIIVEHKDEGAVAVKEKALTIAETILFHLADDLMDPGPSSSPQEQR